MYMPFRAIQIERPYPPTGLTTARWIAEVGTQTVYLSDLILTQKGVRIAGLFGVASEHAAADTLPHVVVWEHQYFLEDGHHRVVREAMFGAHSMLMRVFKHQRPIIRPSEGAGGRFI